MTYPVCIDASVLLRILVPDSYTESAIQRLSIWRQDQARLLAPSLFRYEVTSTLRRYVHAKRLTQEQGNRLFKLSRQFEIALVHEDRFVDRAWQLSERFRRPTAYDTVYLALAEQHQCEFWTADERLYNSVRHRLAWVRWIGSPPDTE